MSAEEYLPPAPVAQGAARGGRGLPRLRPLQGRDPDGLRRGQEVVADGARRRDARRRRGPRGPCLRRAGGARARPRARALGIDRGDVYLTNAVKHFRFEERGKRRIHQTPTARQVTACRPWLAAELRLLKPEALVVMGAVAAKSLLGNAFRVTEQRGRLLDSDLAPIVVATIHPSAVLRAPDDRARIRERKAFTRDLQVAADALARY